jgi:hypothetical protein
MSQPPESESAAADERVDATEIEHFDIGGHVCDALSQTVVQIADRVRIRCGEFGEGAGGEHEVDSVTAAFVYLRSETQTRCFAAQEFDAGRGGGTDPATIDVALFARCPSVAHCLAEHRSQGAVRVGLDATGSVHQPRPTAARRLESLSDDEPTVDELGQVLPDGRVVHPGENGEIAHGNRR